MIVGTIPNQTKRLASVHSRGTQTPISIPNNSVWGTPHSSQSQSFSRSYGPNLPTSLNYCLLKTRGCEPRRPDAVLVRLNKRLQTSNFHGCVKAVRTPRRTRRYSNHQTHSPDELIPGLLAVRKQRKRCSVPPCMCSSTIVLPL